MLIRLSDLKTDIGILTISASEHAHVAAHGR
jgi:hypothetical protein